MTSVPSVARNLHFGGVSTVNSLQNVAKKENTSSLLQNICKMNLMQIKPLSSLAKTMQNSVCVSSVLGRQCTFEKSNLLQPLGTSEYTIPVRTNIRCHFPRPSEVKRIRRHGWKARMATPAGRRVLMRRILKGRHVLSH